MLITVVVATASGSLLAPSLAHIATNVTGLLAAAAVQAGLV